MEDRVIRQKNLFGTKYLCVQNQGINILALMIPALFHILAVEEAKATDAPVQPASKRTIIVAQDGSGEYTSIQTALNNSQPGDTIQVKNGTYDESFTFRISGTRKLTGITLRLMKRFDASQK